MIIYKETALKDFDFWGSAKRTIQLLTEDEIDAIENVLEDYAEIEGDYSETEINDIFAFNTDWIAQLLGYKDWDELLDERG